MTTVTHAQNTSKMWHTSSWKAQKLPFFLLSDRILGMETSPSVAQYTWQPIEYKKSFSTRNGGTSFWKNNDDIFLFFCFNILIFSSRCIFFNFKFVIFQDFGVIGNYWLTSLYPAVPYFNINLLISLFIRLRTSLCPSQMVVRCATLSIITTHPCFHWRTSSKRQPRHSTRDQNHLPWVMQTIALMAHGPMHIVQVSLITTHQDTLICENLRLFVNNMEGGNLNRYPSNSIGQQFFAWSMVCLYTLRMGKV